MIEEYKEISLDEINLEKEILERNPKVFKIRVKELSDYLFVAVINKDPNQGLEFNACSFCKFFLIDEAAPFNINIYKKDFAFCYQFCSWFEKEFEKKTGIEAATSDRCIIFLKESRIGELLSVSDDWDIKSKEIKETVCPSHCGGEINPEDYLRKGCWMKEKNCCPIKLLINKTLKDVN